ncbi:hypothetical protein DSM112329_00392 [Paraconexibacter sp. AEG42_29]|uniref:Peptidase M11 gametolysin domain-containing protein n=1 Tax=Paraconexibacter sp. AEG42_29 TaxID=2997339 RepID=A0AAU7APG9_9ACTN
MLRRNLACALLISLAGAAPAAAAQRPDATKLVQQVRHDGRTVTMRLAKLPLRGPHFELRVQQPDGSYTTTKAPIGERAFLGTVDGRPGAVASGIVTRDGRLRGQIVFDRGATWFTRDAAVTGTRGTDAPVFAWPTRPTVASGRAGTRMRAWDIAVDTDSEYVAARSGSTAAVLEEVEYALSNVRAVYMHDALLMPRLARVIVRAAPARDPYTGDTTYLGPLRDEWRANQKDAVRDEVLLAADGGGNGGVAYGTDMNPDFAYANSGANDDGTFDVVARHEIGHNFDLSDLHAGSPEGKTIIEGNQYARFGGPELQTIFASRGARRGIYDDLGRFTRIPLAPYAALDLIDNVKPGAAVSRNVVGNDHDANGQGVYLASVAAKTSGGGTAEAVGGRVVYRAPDAASTLDVVRYTVADTCGQTATGVVFARTGSATRGSSRRPAVPRTVVLDRGAGGCAQLGSREVARVPLGGLVATARSAQLRVRVTGARRGAPVRVWRCGLRRPGRPSLTVGARGTARATVKVPLAGSRRVCAATGAGGRLRIELPAGG